MKRFIALVFGIMIICNAFSQSGEFEVHQNGLIYSPEAMAKLGHIVDSLNLKFKVCDFDKVYYSKSQTMGYMISLKEGDIKEVKADLDKQISWDDFEKKYPDAVIDKEALIIKRRYKNYEDEDVVEIEHFNLKTDYGFSITSSDMSLYNKDLSNKWLYQYNKKTDYSKESITAFYFPANFVSPVIPHKYGLMIGYADCLIDTTASKMRDGLKEGSPELPENWNKLSKRKKEKLLDEMRSTYVVGFCSMDNRPRDHAFNIALLSAETYNWEVFLKAHLDIMNDRFDRMSDGSYAWAERNTYIKELEELNINVPELLFGISFRYENPAANHYYGSISRLGRALSETENNDQIEQAILSIVSDKELDYYNRLLFYFLYKNYNHYLTDEAEKKASAEKLAIAATSFPYFMSEKLLGK